MTDDEASDGSRSSRTPFIPRLLLLLVLAIILGFGVSRSRLAKQRGFNPDELEHLHFSWLSAQGMVPYRDYFDHHGPLLHQLFAERLRRGVTDPVDAIGEARGLSLGFTLAVLSIGGIVVGAEAGMGASLIFVVLLCSSANFIVKSLEFRPDVPAALFLVIAIGLQTAERGRLAGVAAGIALLFTPKCLFGVAGIAGSLCVTRSGVRGDLRRRIVEFSAGVSLPLLVAAVWLLQAGGLGRAFQFAVVEAARWRGPSPGPVFIDFILTDSVLVTLLTVSGVATLRRWSVASPLSRICLSVVAAGLAGLFLVTYPSRQFLLLTLPAGAALAALWWDQAARTWFPEERRRTASHVILAGVIAAAGFPEHVRAFARGNTAAVVAMDQIARNTDTEEQVLDGFIGYAPLRGHGTFFPFLHRDVRELRERTEPSLLNALRDGRVLPKFALMNHYLREGVEPAVWQFLEANYATLDKDDEVRVRLFDNGLGFWRDTGARSLIPNARHEPHVLALSGWSAPRAFEGVSGRWLSPGGSSTIVLPVRDPEPFDLLLKVVAAEPVTLRVEVNGTGLDPLMLAAGSTIAVIQTGPLVWRAGLNRIVLDASSSRRVCLVSSVGLQRRDQAP